MKMKRKSYVTVPQFHHAMVSAILWDSLLENTVVITTNRVPALYFSLDITGKLYLLYSFLSATSGTYVSAQCLHLGYVCCKPEASCKGKKLGKEKVGKYPNLVTKHG